MKSVVISVREPSNNGGAEIVWENIKKQGILFDNISLDSKNLPKRHKFIPNILHLKEIFASRWLLKEAIKINPQNIIYDKVFGWPKTKWGGMMICYNHGSYTLAGLTFKEKNKFIYLFYKYVLSYFERKSYENADKIVAVSESVRDEMVEYFKIPSEKIVVINNAVNLDKFKPMKNKKLLKKYGLPEDKKKIFFPGRPSFGKGFDIAEKVLEKLGDEYFMFALGKGSSELKNVKFMGKISNDEMPEIYNCADICLFPSRYEGNSVSVLESAACGTPLILSKVGEMKTNKKMQKYVCGSVEEYVKKIEKLDSKRDSVAWRSFSKSFSIIKQTKKLMELLKNEK